ncbi:MAG TPA: hypothetical protein VEV41_04780 [Terriglobales bacterium]|nr:hypothetical protein [Terriglobales bacterium]
MAKPVAWRVNTGHGWTLHHTLDEARQAAGVRADDAQEKWRRPDGPIQPLYTIDDAIEEALSMVTFALQRKNQENQTE